MSLSFKIALNDYLMKHEKLPTGNSEYNTIEGYLRFVKGNNNDVVLDVICVKEEFRQRGILTNFLKYIIDKQIPNVWIVSVISDILYHYLMRFNYNGYRFKLCRIGFRLTQE
jgi:hypothetical protein